jgi:asparagine synthase (glutamine-hydrolysing)
MSAIFGQVQFDGAAIAADSFIASFAKLQSYGPDLSQHWIEGPIAAGRHLLRVAPSADHERPPTLIDGAVIVADAILDNRAELALALGLSSAQLAAASDTDLIRDSFLRWGESCVDHLIGDFAFAAIRPDRREVFLARDHIGARPLFWALRDRTFLFGSAIAGIVAFREWSWPIDERMVAEFLFSPITPVSKPFFRDVQAVPAGSSVSVHGGRVSTSRWWRPSASPSRDFKSKTDAAAACRTLLERAISDRTNTAGRIGAHFSGGIDSTGVAVIGARALRASGRSLVRGYAWSPSISEQYPADHPKDERGSIQQLADAEGVPIAFGVADGDNFLAFTQRPMEFDGDADLADEIPVLRAAGADGLRVMLSGWGGDEVFSAHGRGYLAALALKGRFARWKNFAHAYAPSLWRVLLPLLWRELVQPILPGPLYQLTSPYRHYIAQASFISNTLLQQNADLIEKRRASIKFGPDPNKNLLRHFTAGHITMRMESWAAWSAPSGFQYRYPLTDRRLIEFLFTLPPEHLFMNDQPRGLARAALTDCIPPTAGKEDIANERMRRDTRDAAWRMLAQQVVAGAFADDCPWLDMKAFRAQAMAPTDQSTPHDILLFAQISAAARIYHLYRRAVLNGWA